MSSSPINPLSNFANITSKAAADLKKGKLESRTVLRIFEKNFGSLSDVEKGKFADTHSLDDIIRISTQKLVNRTDTSNDEDLKKIALSLEALAKAKEKKLNRGFGIPRLFASIFTPKRLQDAENRIRNVRIFSSEVKTLLGAAQLKEYAYQGTGIDLIKIEKLLGKEEFSKQVASVIRQFPANAESYKKLNTFLKNLETNFPSLKNSFNFVDYDEKTGEGRSFTTESVKLIVKNSNDLLKNNCTVCDSPEEFGTKLKERKKFPHAFIVRCKYFGGDTVHFTPLYVTKGANNQFEILSTDSVVNFLYIYPIYTQLEKMNIDSRFISPEGPKNSEDNSVRQKDSFNCALFAVHDMNYWLKNPKVAGTVIEKAKKKNTEKSDREINEIKNNNALTEEEKKNRIHIISLSSKWFLSLQPTEFYPPQMMKTAQSLTLIDQFKKAQLENAKNDSKKTKELESEFTTLDKKLAKHTRVINSKKQNWYIENKARKNIAKVVQLRLMQTT